LAWAQITAELHVVCQVAALQISSPHQLRLAAPTVTSFADALRILDFRIQFTTCLQDMNYVLAGHDVLFAGKFLCLQDMSDVLAACV
jgi:hypothetical protein